MFSLCDALLCETTAQSLPELSQSPFFERQWSSLYQALDNGKINEEHLRQAWVEALLEDTVSDEPIWISVDSSSIARPQAKTSADRGIIHVANVPCGCKPISVGWQFSTVMVLPEEPSSWVGILDQRRIATSQTAIEVAISQLRAVIPLLKRPVFILTDRRSATAEFLQACQQLGCQVLIRRVSQSQALSCASAHKRQRASSFGWSPVSRESPRDTG